MDDAPMDAVASAILVLMTCARDWDANMPSIVAYVAAAVSTDEIWERMSRDSEDRR